MRIVAVVQSRMGSSRLPGKIMRHLAGAPLLERLLERLRGASSLDDVVVATTWLTEDEPIRSLCARLDVRCISGHPVDLLDRHLQAGRESGADVVAKIPSDCPLIDPRIVDRLVDLFRNAGGQVDYLSNLHPASYPDGCDVELVPMPVLTVAGREASQPHEREHTTPYIWDRPQRFNILNVAWESGLDYSMTHRLTIDYAEDLALVRAVFDALWTPQRPIFGLGRIIDFLEARPDVAALNRHLAGVNWYRHHLKDLRTIGAHETVFLEDA